MPTKLTTALAAAAAGLALAALGAPAAQATSARVVATVPGANNALDATPDPGGRTIYFSTDGPDGPAIFRVPAAGGKVRAVLRGRPLVDPVGLAVSSDGKRLFVADPGAGRILVVPVDGSRPRSLAGSAGTRPRGLEVRGRRIVFTGRDPSDGAPAVLSLGVAGAKRATIIAKGTPLRRPQAVALASDGTIFVSDRGFGRALDGRILRIDAGGAVTHIAGGVRLGDPAGIALTKDESALLVSSLNATAGTAQVLIIDLATRATSVYDDKINANTTAGGLHRAQASTIMAWADVLRPGRIYRVDP